MTRAALLKYARPAAALLVLVAGLVIRASGSESTGQLWLMGGLALTGAPIVWQTAKGVLRRRFAADIVASLSIIGALLLDQPVAGLVIVLMQSGGEALEQYAAGRASAAVRELEARAPRIAHRSTATGALEEISADAIRSGDVLVVRPGELIPCDGVVIEGSSHLDTASLTGEPLPVRASSGLAVLSGSINQEAPLTIRSVAPASESQYARIVEMVRSAQASKAPLQRLADRYAIWFTPAVLLACIVTWLATADATRVLAVLVVATPCPLLIATPVAIIGGINRAARDGIIVRSGAALEQAGTVDHIVFDKTGTLTIGRPVVKDVTMAPGSDPAWVLPRVAALEEMSSHLLARSVVAALANGVSPVVSRVVEDRGRGIRGMVDGAEIAIGSRAYVTDAAPQSAADFARLDGRGGALRAFVTTDGRAAAIIEFADQARPDLSEALAMLRSQGIRGISLVSGDDTGNVQKIAAEAGITDARGDLLAEDKVSVVRDLLTRRRRVMMVGDGTNDAPALMTATVGVALAEHGGGISAESADVIVLRDDLRLVPRMVGISRRTRRIAQQSIWTGLAPSGIGMAAAMAGVLPPTAGALAQEGIDLAVIVNALRAVTGTRRQRQHARSPS